ncbi:MAG: hypothetical protein SGILL_000938 [Bacillariaceae sp.]
MGGKNKNKKRPAPPKPGDPDYKTPTQLRNARKRRKLQKEKAAKNGGGGANAQKGPSSDGAHISNQKQHNSSLSSSAPKDPSLKYIDNPKSAPTVKAAKRFFENIFRNQPDSVGEQSSYIFPIFVGPKTGWRSVARLAVRPSIDKKKVKIGLFVPGSHQLLEVPDCPAHHPRINDAVKMVQQACNDVGVAAFDEHSGCGNLRYVAVSVERSTGKQQVVLVWKEEEDSAGKLDKLIQKLTRKSNGNESKLDLHSLWIHYNNAWKHANSIFDRNGRWEQRFGNDNEQGVEEILLNDDTDSNTQLPQVTLNFPPQVFRQANIDAFAKIVLKIRHWLGEQRDASSDRKKRLGHCLELYGGVGTIGLNLVDLFESIESSDENPFNKACFEASVKKINVKGKSLKPSRQEKIVYRSKSATDMVQGTKGRASLDEADVIIVDPPRKGLDSEVVEAVNASKCDKKVSSSLQTLVYVSCGFDAFRRDYDALVKSRKWKLNHAEGHILFPGSDAIETLAIFTNETS